MGFFDDLQRQLGLDDDVDRKKLSELGLEPRPPLDPRRWALGSPEEKNAHADLALNPHDEVMVPPPPESKPRNLGLERTLAFVKDQEPAMQHASDDQVRQVVGQAAHRGRVITGQEPPDAPPPVPPDELASMNLDELMKSNREDARGRMNAAADESQAAAEPAGETLGQKAARVLRQAGRGAGRLSDLAEKPFAWESPAPDDGSPNMSQEPAAPPEIASMPKPASYDTSSAQKLIARARGAAMGPKGADPAADLRARYAKGGGQAPGAPPEAPAAAETPAPGQADAATPPPMPPPEPGSEGGPLAALKSRLLSASADPRTEGLRAALAKAAEMKRVAGHITGMGIGADLALGTHVHGNQGKALEDQADDVVRQETLPAKFDNENRRADLEQAKGLQDLELRGNQDRRAAGAEGRANHAETRAQAAEQRASRKGATEQDLSDPNSRVSQNMRAAAESLYPSAWQKIPQRIRDAYSASDVERVFKEISMKDFAAKGPSRAAGTEDRFEEKQVQDFNKNRITDRSVTAVNNLMGRLEDPSPIQGFDAAKGWAKSEKIPLLGGLLSGAGNSAVRGTEMEGIAQDALTIMQQISLDTSGKVLNEHEMNNIEKRLGLAAGQGEDAFRRAMKSEFDAIQSKADRDYESLSPGAREKVDQRKLRPTFKASSSTGYAPKENTVLDERAKDTKSTFSDLLDKAKSFF